MTSVSAHIRVKIVRHVADLIDESGLTGEDVRDVAYAVDWEPEQDYTDQVGDELHAYLMTVTHELDESAADLIQSATKTVLGWVGTP